MLKCAFYESDITPLLYSNMPGYFSERPGRDIKDKIYAKAVVFEGGNGVKVAMVAVDANFITEDFCSTAVDRIVAHTDIKAENITISATHIHNGGPMVDWGKLVKRDEAYVKFSAEKAADAVIVADLHLRPVKAGYANGCVEDISFNRIYVMKDGTLQTNPGKHNPDIVRPQDGIDPDVTVLRVDDAESGEPLGAIVNFACHEDCVGQLAFSGDFASQLSDRLKEAYGIHFVSVFFPGTCGNINHFDVNTDKDTVPDYYRIMGDKLAAEVKRVWPQAEYTDDDSVYSVREYLSIKKRMVDADMHAECERIVKTVKLREDEEIGSQSDPDQLSAVFAYDLLNYSKDTSEYKRVPVQYIRVGGFAFYCLPGEVFVQYGRRIKAESPLKRRFIFTNSNGLYGYIPLPDMFMPTVYESRLGCTSYLEPRAGEMITAEALELARKERGQK